MTELQRVIFNYEGTINKLLVDDKGGVCVPCRLMNMPVLMHLVLVGLLGLCVFGLAPFIHQGDDPVRAVCAALDLAAGIRYGRADIADTCQADGLLQSHGSGGRCPRGGDDRISLLWNCGLGEPSRVHGDGGRGQSIRKADGEGSGRRCALALMLGPLFCLYSDWRSRGAY